MRAVKAKAIHKIAVRIARGRADEATMQVVKKRVAEDNYTKKGRAKDSQYQRVLNHMGPRAIGKRLKRLYVNRTIKVSVLRDGEKRIINAKNSHGR